MLARAIFTTVYRGLRTAPDVFAKTAINFVLSGFALAHRISFKGYSARRRWRKRALLCPPFSRTDRMKRASAIFIHGTRQMKRQRDDAPAMAAFSHPAVILSSAQGRKSRKNRCSACVSYHLLRSAIKREGTPFPVSSLALTELLLMRRQWLCLFLRPARVHSPR